MLISTICSKIIEIGEVGVPINIIILFFHVEPPPVRLYYQLSDTLCIDSQAKLRLYVEPKLVFCEETLNKYF